MKSHNKETAVAAPTCPVCRTALARHGLVLCRKCQTPHHRRCWSYNKGCGVYGCECRALVLPRWAPTSEPGEPHHRFEVHWVYPTDRYGGWWALVLMLLLVVKPVLFLPVLAAVLLPLALSTRHTVNLETGMLERRHLLGGVPWFRRLGYLPLHEVETLELRRRPPVIGGGAAARSTWEVWVRDVRDRATLLEVTPRATEDQVLERLEAPAEQMDTILTLPQGGAEEGELPAGLRRALERLPHEELPDED